MRSSITAVVAGTWLCALALAGGAHVGREAAAVAWFTAAVASIGAAHLLAVAVIPRIAERLPFTARPATLASDRVLSRRVF